MRRENFRLYFKNHSRAFAAGIALLVATNALALSIPWLLKRAVESLPGQPLAGSGPGVGACALAIILVAGVMAIVRTGSRMAFLGASRRISYELRRRLFERLLLLPPSYYDRMRTGDLMSRAVNDMQLIRSFFGPGLMNAVNTLLAYAGTISVMAWINPRLTLLSLLPYPFVLFTMNRLSRALYHRSVAAQEQLATISSRVQENLSGMQQVKAFVREEAEKEEFAALASEYRRRNLALARTRGGIVPLMGSISGIGTLAVLWLGGRYVIEGRMTLGDFVAFNAYLASLAWPTLALGWIINVFQRGLGAMERIGEILEAPLPAGADVPARPARNSPPGIELRGLTFAYEGASAPALRDVTVAVEPGTLLGITGPVGSGKSTLLSLVAGLYAPTRGQVLLGGSDLADGLPPFIQGRLGFVPQESFLLSRSIAENIALGRPQATREEIERAAGLARLAEDLPDFPQGWDTVVGERGITLSGGQRQRVALARALLVDPALLVLDDTLSAVDARTEIELIRNLREFMRERTCLIASHRISALESADRIIVLEAGRVVESGTHLELLAGGGLYARLHRQQQLEDQVRSTL